MSPAEKSAYHHGELPATLMALAVGQIEESGTEKLSLRALAREAGVSSTAPYKHFPTKRCLLAAIATRGFGELRTLMMIRLEPIADIGERFLAMGLAYLEFAQANPVAYRLMFGSVVDDFSDYEMLRQAAETCYEVVDDTLRELIERRGLNLDPVVFGGVVWSTVHGLASLLIDKKAMSGQPSKPAQAIHAVATDPEAALMLAFGHLMDQE